MSGRSQFLLLFANAWRRFATLDGLARNSDPRSVLILAAIVCGVPGAFIAFFLAIPVRVGGHWQLVDARPVLNETAWFSALLVALAALLEWNALIPDPGDCAVLAPLPVARQTAISAHAAALAALLAILTGIANASSLVLIPMLDAIHMPFLMGVARQAATVVVTALIAFSAVVILRALALSCACVPLLRWAGRLLHALSLTAVIAALLALPAQSELRWAWGRGFASPLPLAPWAAALAFAACGFFLAAGNRAFHPQPHPRGNIPTRVRTRMGGAPARAAAVQFAFRTIARADRQRAIVVVWFALGAGTVLASAVRLPGVDRVTPLAAPVPIAISAPLLLELFLLVGLRSSFAVPVDIRANWIFRVSSVRRPQEMSGAARSVMRLYLGALLLPVAAFELWFWPLPVASEQLAFLGLIGLLWIQCLTWNCRKIPFTCSYQPGGARLMYVWPVYAFGFIFAAYVLGGCERWLLQDFRRAACSLLLLAAALAVLERRSRRSHLAECQFEDDPEPVVQTLLTG